MLSISELKAQFSFIKSSVSSIKSLVLLESVDTNIEM
jgi:hypothetical protein